MTNCVKRITKLILLNCSAMKRIPLLLIALFIVAGLHAQSDSLALLKEAAARLQNKSATVNQLLTDKKYLAIHPADSFRRLIQNYCSTGLLQITTADEPGKKIKVTGHITNKEGNPLGGALVYLYQTDYRGWYAAASPHVGGNEGDMRHARLFGYVKTDAQGKFELHTVKPSGYPQSDLPAHIHVHVWMTGYQPYVSEFLFDDDERLAGRIREQAVNSRFSIAKPESATAPFVQQFSYTIVLGKK